MGHKINPTSFRLKITDTWKSKWFSKNQFVDFLREDTAIRDYIEKHLKKAGISRVDIERSGSETVVVTIKAAKQGLIIGKGGAGIEDFKRKMKTTLKLKREVKINIEQENNPSLKSAIIAQQIAEQLEKRMPFRRLMKQTLEQVMTSGGKGIKVAISGRLNGADIARTEHLSAGKIPLHTLRADIDFARSTAHTTFGTIGIKVWVYRGDMLGKKS